MNILHSLKTKEGMQRKMHEIFNGCWNVTLDNNKSKALHIYINPVE